MKIKDVIIEAVDHRELQVKLKAAILQAMDDTLRALVNRLEEDDPTDELLEPPISMRSELNFNDPDSLFSTMLDAMSNRIYEKTLVRVRFDALGPSIQAKAVGNEYIVVNISLIMDMVSVVIDSMHMMLTDVLELDSLGFNYDDDEEEEEEEDEDAYIPTVGEAISVLKKMFNTWNFMFREYRDVTIPFVTTLIHEIGHFIQISRQLHYQKNVDALEYRSYLMKDKKKFAELMKNKDTDYKFKLYYASPQEIAAYAQESAYGIILEILGTVLDSSLENKDSVRDVLFKLDQAILGLSNNTTSYQIIQTYRDFFYKPANKKEFAIYKRFIKIVYQQLTQYRASLIDRISE